MERLTMRSPIDNGVLIKNKSSYQSICFGGDKIGYCIKCYEEKALEKLADYEDAEERGLLLRVPCKIGNDVYFIPSKTNYKLNAINMLKKNNNRVYHQKVSRIVFTNNGWYLKLDRDLEFGTGHILLDCGSYKETWFLTEEQAEQALARMGESEAENECKTYIIQH